MMAERVAFHFSKRFEASAASTTSVVLLADGEAFAFLLRMSP